MKKVVLGVLFSVVSLVAGSINFADGSYSCIPYSIVDNNWNDIYKFSRNEVENKLIRFYKKDNVIVSGNEKYIYTITDHNIDIYTKTGPVKAFILIKDEDVKNQAFIVGFVLNNKKMKMACLKSKVY